jgi:hypothetical protein
MLRKEGRKLFGRRDAMSRSDVHGENDKESLDTNLAACRQLGSNRTLRAQRVAIVRTQRNTRRPALFAGLLAGAGLLTGGTADGASFDRLNNVQIALHQRIPGGALGQAPLADTSQRFRPQIPEGLVVDPEAGTLAMDWWGEFKDEFQKDQKERDEKAKKDKEKEEKSKKKSKKKKKKQDKERTGNSGSGY